MPEDPEFSFSPVFHGDYLNLSIWNSLKQSDVMLPHGGWSKLVAHQTRTEWSSLEKPAVTVRGSSPQSQVVYWFQMVGDFIKSI